MKLDPSFWDKRYQDQETQWDIGYSSPPLTAYLETVENKDCQVLIPGAGNAYEAEYLWENGFRNTSVLDWSQEAVDRFIGRVPKFPTSQVFCEDFFKHQRQYDLIVEQTFFCALTPDWREDYVRQMASLLKDGGKLFGLLFDFPLTSEGPPFGGDEALYRELLGTHFHIEKMETAHNSIKPRSGRELFFIAQKREN